MNQQCNSCGGFHDINKCPTCLTLICARCRTNHEQGCSQAADMKRKGQGPTVHAAPEIVVETSRPNSVAPVDQKVVTDGPFWYEGGLEPASVPSTTEELASFAYALDILAMADALKNPLTNSIMPPFIREIINIQEEPKNENVSETVLQQEQNTQGPLDNQGSQEHSEQPASIGNVDSGNLAAESNAPGIDSDGASAPVEQVDQRSQEPPNEFGEIPYNAIERV